jgi:hypothetical protein
MITLTHMPSTIYNMYWSSKVLKDLKQYFHMEYVILSVLNLSKQSLGNVISHMFMVLLH